MSEIWNLSTLCRCCHSDGCFKKLNVEYNTEKHMKCVEVYEYMLLETLGIQMIQPTVDQASYMICDNCIKRLRDAAQFKEQVLACEQKFKVYCTNEQFFNSNVPIENVKSEVESNIENNDFEADDEMHGDDGYIQTDGYQPKSDEIKEEVTITVDVGYPVKEEDEKVDIKCEEKEEKKNILSQEEGKKEEESVKIIKENTKKTAKKNRSVERLRLVAAYNQNYLKNRRQLFETYIKREKNDNGVIYSCKTCGSLHKTKRNIFDHVKDEHYNRCKCEQCGKAFKFESHLENHVVTYHGKTYVCSHCDRAFDNKYRLATHEKTHTDQPKYQCDVCQKVLRYKNTLKKHVLLHSSDNKAMLCDVCGWSFNQKCNLEAHIKSVHLKMRPYSCSICSKTYTAKKHVKNHMKIAHSGNPKPYQCDQCTKCFACPKSLKTHKLAHENHFSCRYCSLVFNNKSDVDTHTKSHTKQHLLTNAYPCHVCGNVLMSRFTLKRHLEVHSGIKRFVCNVCGMKFTQKSLLQRHHLRKHDPNVKREKVKCDLCKKFVGNIEKHMDIHDVDKRKYFCDMCGKNYPTNNALTRHKEQKHYGVSYDCDMCGKKYIKKGSLKTHKLKVHKIKKETLDSVTSVQNIELTDVVT